MAGRSIQHNQIVRNSLFTTEEHVPKINRCQTFLSDQKIHSAINSLFTNPDLSIVCGDIETLENHKDISNMIAKLTVVRFYMHINSAIHLPSPQWICKPKQIVFIEMW